MGLNRKIAYVDLTTSQVNMSSIPIEMREKYVGGRGLNSYLLYHHLKPGVNPLSPENVVVVGAGLLGGMLAPAPGWTNIVTKSAINGYLGSLNIGEFLAPELRWAGFDQLVIKGKSPKPSFLFIHNGRVQIRDAASLWGKTTQDTQSILKKELQDEDIQTLCIGPAGEKQVRFAGIVSRYHNAGGRTGIGAVLGSKNLKAIVARGAMDIKVEFPEEALAYDKEIVRSICSNATGKILQQGGILALAAAISGNTHDDYMGQYIAEHSTGMDACFGCQLHCRRRYAVEEGTYAGAYVESPEFGCPQIPETEIGSVNMNNSLAVDYLARSYGLDPWETGSLISWTMKLYENGILSDEDTKGLSLAHDDAFIELLHLIGRREGLGNTLAEGALAAARKIGKNSEKYLIQVKGLASCHTDILTSAMALSQAVGVTDSWWYRPSIDLCGLPESDLKRIYSRPHAFTGPLSTDRRDCEGKPWMVFWHELCEMAADMLGICRLNTAFLSPDMPGFEEFSKMIYLNTGLKLSGEQIWECASRAGTLERLFNLREGYTGKDDRLPEHYFDESPAAGAGDKAINDSQFRAMIAEYYKIHEWDENGVPEPQLLKRLGLDTEPGHRL